MTDSLSEAIERTGRAVIKGSSSAREITSGDLYELLLAARRWNALEKIINMSPENIAEKYGEQTIATIIYKEFMAAMEIE